MENNNNEIKICKHCQSEIPKKAKVCPVCRKKQRSVLKIVGIVFLIFILIGLFAPTEEKPKEVGRVESSQDKADGGATNEGENKEEENEELTVGSIFEVGDLRISVNEASTDFQDYENEYGWHTPKEGMKYVMASFTFENIGKSGDKYVSIYDFDCYADDTVCEQQYGLDNSDFMNTNLSPGRNVSFKTYYAVPKDAAAIELEYVENMFTDKRILIKIQ